MKNAGTEKPRPTGRAKKHHRPLQRPAKHTAHRNQRATEAQKNSLNPQDRHAALISHFQELKRRLIYGLAAFTGATALAYAWAPQILQFLIRPLAHLLNAGSGRRLIYTGLSEAFVTHLKIAFLSGFVLSLPLLLYQIWRFVSPGLRTQERRIFSKLLFAAPLLFIAGSLLAYHVICPLAWKFFLSFEQASTSAVELPIELEGRISEYLSLILKLVSVFGWAFQLPLVIFFIVTTGLVSLETLRRARRYVFLGIVVVAAIITPPDMISPFGLIVPAYFLFEATLWLIQRSLKNHAD